MTTNADILDEVTVGEDTESFELVTKSGRKITLQVRALTWTDETDAASKAVRIVQEQQDGKAGTRASLEYNVTVYRIEVLKRRIVQSSCPFPLTDQVLRKLDPEVGRQLAALVPDPFEGMVKAQDAPKD